MTTSLLAALDGLEDLLAASEAFTGSIDLPTEGDIREKRIFWEAIHDEEGEILTELPAAAIVEGEHSYQLFAHGEGLQLGAAGSIRLMLAAAATHADNHKQSRRAFLAWSTQIVDEIALLIAEGNHYQFSGVTLAQRAVRSPKKDRTGGAEDFWWCSYEFSFGLDE